MNNLGYGSAYNEIEQRKAEMSDEPTQPRQANTNDWKAEPAKLVGEPVIDDYEVKIVFNDGTKTALYFTQLDFISSLNLFNVDRVIITPRWRNKDV